MPADLPGDGWGAPGVALAVVVALRLLDALLPKGWHLRLLARWLERDTPRDDLDDEEE